MKKTLSRNLAIAMACGMAVAGAQAALVTGGAGEPAWYPGGDGYYVAVRVGAQSTSDLTFSSGSSFDGVDPGTLGGLIGALNSLGVTISGTGGGFVPLSTVMDEFGDEVRAGAVVRSNMTSLTLDSTTGGIAGIGGAGGVVFAGSRVAGTLNGGVASVTNLRFDLVNKTVRADLQGTKSALGTNPAVNYNLLNTVLWNIGEVSGPTSVSPLYQQGAPLYGGSAALEAAGFQSLGMDGEGWRVFQSTYVLSGLTITTTGFDFFKNSLGLLSNGVNALSAVNLDPQGWGSLTATMEWHAAQATTAELGGFEPPIPEPGTSAMMVLGLAGVVTAVRRRRP